MRTLINHIKKLFNLNLWPDRENQTGEMATKGIEVTPVHDNPDGTTRMNINARGFPDLPPPASSDDNPELGHDS